ncbi:MAG: hypothetical protein WCC82_12030 [Nitrososphaeraceae archaeon]|jgi:hypothetical protein
MAMRTEPIPNNKTLISGAIAAITRGASPPIMKNSPPIIASIATIVTPSGRYLVELFSVLYHGSINTHE